MLSRASRFVDRRYRRILGAAVLSTAVAAVFGLGVAQRLGPAGFVDPRSDSTRANEQLARAGALGPDVVIRVEGARAGERALRERVARVRELVRAEPLVARVSVAAIAAPRRAGVATARSAAYVRAALRAGSDAQRKRTVQRIERSLSAREGILVGGSALVDPQLTHTIEEDFKRAELIALPIVFLLSLLFFRGFVAATLPPLLGAMAILGTLLVLRVVSTWVEVSVLSLNLITALGLGLAVDYSLFMVTRYREELARHGPTPAALRATMLSAGRTVLFSSLTIAAIMASLLVFPQSVLFSMGLGGLVVALVSALVSLIVLPAILTLLGVRVNALSPRRLKRRAAREARPLTSGFWYRLSAFVTRRAAVIAIAVAALLLALTVPALRTAYQAVDPSTLPADTSVRQVFDATRADGSLRRASAVRVLVHGAGRRDVRRLTRRLRRLPGVGHVGRPRALPGRAVVVGVQSRSGVYAAPSRRLVQRIRTDPLASRLLVTGPTAEFVDLQASLRGHLPLALVLVVLATMLALFLMTGSLVMGVKVLLMNALNLGAVYGLLVLVFQDGRLESLLGYTSPGALDTSAPVLLFAAVFALSTDYGIFLLARVKEAFDGGRPNDEAVAVGQERTGRAITSAAALFCVSVGALMSSRIVPVQETALGFAAAVMIDATLIRALLMPALMHLLGDWNWWAPPALHRLHRRVGLVE
jgi:RND superfamily putative drug exporter